jgi:hypothetical protein
MKRILSVLGIGALLVTGLNAAAFATLRPIPLQMINVLQLPESVTLGVGEMLCVVAGPEVGRDVSVNLTAVENGSIEWTRRGNDQRPGKETYACFDTVAPGDATIEVSATVMLSLSRIESKVHVKVK